jgi:RHH-type proline utilization regulon transcriptional repressor/proline dehydrogenase/delta 1-pyrroline-5-carboxylate dehydrogenase
VNQIVDENVPPEVVAADPFDQIVTPNLPKGSDLFAPHRANAKGWDITHRRRWLKSTRRVIRFMPTSGTRHRCHQLGRNPQTKPATCEPPLSDTVGHIVFATPDGAKRVIAAAVPWMSPQRNALDVLRNQGVMKTTLKNCSQCTVNKTA